MDPNDFRNKILSRPRRWLRRLYHFTDTANIASIRQHGILSKHALDKGEIAVTPGGNDWSLEADQKRGLDKYVHLSFFDSHPMLHMANKDGRLLDHAHLQISAEVVLKPGVLFCDVVSNQTGSKPVTITALNEENYDFDILFLRLPWGDPPITKRLNLAKKFEILVPDLIELDYITFPDGI